MDLETKYKKVYENITPFIKSQSRRRAIRGHWALSPDDLESEIMILIYDIVCNYDHLDSIDDLS